MERVFDIGDAARSATSRLDWTDDEIEAVRRANHRPTLQGSWCAVEYHEPWPCTAARLVATVDRLRADGDPA